VRRWLHPLLSEAERYRVFLRRKGRPPKGTIPFPLPLLCAIDAGETTGVALLSPSWAVVLEADDEDFQFAQRLFSLLPKQATVCVESGFCPCADAVFRAGVYTGLAYGRGIVPTLIHPNAKAQIFKQSPLPAKRLLISHTLETFNLALIKAEGDGYFQHATDAVGLAFAYLRRAHNIPTPKVQLMLNYADGATTHS
jgi:hypothetical protein